MNKTKRKCINCNNILFNKYLVFADSEILKCINCGLGIRSPFKIKKNHGDFFEARISQTRIWDKIFNNILDKIEKFSKKGSLLDVGSSEGRFLSIGKNRGWDVKGIDTSLKAVQYSRKKYNVDVTNVSIEHMGKYKFDVIVFSHVIEHMQDPLSSLKKANELLREGGYIYVAVPNMNCIWAKIFKNKWFNWQPEQHLWHFQKKHMKNIIKRAGFKPIYAVTSSIFLPYITWTKRIKEIINIIMTPFGFGEEIIIIGQKSK